MAQIKSILLTGAILPFIAVGLTSCATVSEDTCVAGSWEDVGYNDGRKGRSRGRFADIAKTCAKYNVTPDRVSYMRGYNLGVPLYCTYDRGFERGESGSAPKDQCIEIDAVSYLEGQADGYAAYELRREYNGLIAQYDDTLEALVEVRRRLDEEELEDKERKRLRKKALRLEDRREDLRIDIRAFERIHGWPKYQF